MPWSYANIDWAATRSFWSAIDWSATALCAVAVPVATTFILGAGSDGKARKFLQQAWMRGGPSNAAIGAFLFAALMIQVVAIHDEDGWFGQATAAWVQAVGSIAAIAGASWIAGAQARREDARRAEDRAERSLERRRDAFECLAMIATAAKQTIVYAKNIAHQLETTRVPASDLSRVYHPKILELRNDVEGLLHSNASSVGVRQLAYNVRGLIGNVAFTLQGTAASVELGHALAKGDVAMLVDALRKTAADLEGHVAEAEKGRAAIAASKGWK